MSFLPKGYEVPRSEGGSYWKPKQGDNRVRILTDPLMGWVYWTNQNKPARSLEYPDEMPDARINERTGSPDKPKHFWAVVVYDYENHNIAIWEITQGTIQGMIAGYASDADWGHPSNYDLKVTRSGSGLDTEYNVVTKPAKSLHEEVIKAFNAKPIDLYALLTGDNPFDAEHHTMPLGGADGNAQAAPTLERIDEDDIPF